MIQSKKIGWVSVLFFVLMFSLHPGIVAASDSTTLSFPGNGYVGVSLHTEIPETLNWMILGITQSDFNHCWVTATVDGIQGVIHSDGCGGVHFLYWPNFLELCEPESIRLFKPNKKAIGYAELEGFGINLSRIPQILRNLLARRLGNLMIHIWIQEMLAYRGVEYDCFFMPQDDKLYCSELLGHGWNNTGSSFEVFPSQEACTLDGWDVDTHQPDGVTYGMLLKFSGIDENTAIYNVAEILNNPYFKEISVD
nr:hypothetical protein [uncultured Desulfobacter sp.]